MQNVSYEGIKATDLEKAEMTLDAFRHLGMSKIPEQYGNEGGQLRLVLSKSGKDKNGKYHAAILKPLSAVGKEECKACEKIDFCSFAGELYFPMEAEQSYRMVIGDGFEKIGKVIVPWLKRGRYVQDDNMGFGIGYQEFEPMSAEELWRTVRQERVLEAIETSLHGLTVRIDRHCDAQKMKALIEVISGSGDGIIDGLDKLFDNIIGAALLSDEQNRAAGRIVVNIKNYMCYLTGE